MTDGRTGGPTLADRRRHRHRAWLAAAAVAVLMVVAATKLTDSDDPCGAPSTAPAAEIALLPGGLSFDRIGTITQVRKDELHVTVRAVTTKPVDEATVLIQDAVVAAGYRPAGMDNEGVEAEVFFTRGPYAGGSASVEPSPCSGRSDIDLVLLDRAG